MEITRLRSDLEKVKAANIVCLSNTLNPLKTIEEIEKLYLHNNTIWLHEERMKNKEEQYLSKYLILHNELFDQKHPLDYKFMTNTDMPDNIGDDSMQIELIQVSNREFRAPLDQSGNKKNANNVNQNQKNL